MRIFTDRLIPAKHDQVCVGLQCDLCGKKSKSCSDWSSSGYEINETEIHYKNGVSYPESGASISIDVDLCPTCFTEKLIPWLISQGANIQQEDSSW